jgi:signal transduction histidine kinase
VRRHGYKILFAAALVLLVALSTWWTLLIHRSIQAERDAALKELELRWVLASHEYGLDDPYFVDCPDRELGELEIRERYKRRSFMVMGEGALLFLLLGVCMVMLLRLFQQDRQRLEATRNFISSVTHEMKSPLAGIKSLLQTAAADNLPDDRRDELLGMGLGEAERLEHMVENLLIARRLRSDRQPVKMRLERLGPLLDSVIAHRREFLSRPETLEAAYEDGAEGVQVLVDVDGLRVALENLIDNAVKYGGNHPEVSVNAGLEDDRVRIQVRDRGVGFEAADAEGLFMPFHRSMREGASTRHGTGLGLSIARELARRMGGDLTAESDGPGKGSCFTIWLPGRPG